MRITVQGEKRTAVIYKRIGKTLYKIRVHLDGESKETIDDKILRLIANEVVTNAEQRAIIGTLQVTRPPERISA